MCILALVRGTASLVFIFCVRSSVAGLGSVPNVAFPRCLDPWTTLRSALFTWKKGMGGMGDDRFKGRAHPPLAHPSSRYNKHSFDHTDIVIRSRLKSALLS